MPILYLLSPGAVASKSGGRVVVAKDGSVQYSIPLKTVKQVVISKYAQISTQLIAELIVNKVIIIYVDYKGRVLSYLGGHRVGANKLIQQVNLFTNSVYQLELARYIVKHKIMAQTELLKRYVKKDSSGEINNSLQYLKQAFFMCQRSASVEKLRGTEGMASKYYFEAFSSVLRADTWQWVGREHKGTMDPVNSLLSYAYSFLEREVRLAMMEIYLDERIGVLHSNNGRKDSLVYDLMDLLRQKVTDRLVLKVLNVKTFSIDDFVFEEKGCFLSSQGQVKWIEVYEKYMETEFKGLDGLTPRKLIEREVKDFYKQVREYQKETADNSK
ncbi:CRISPR-associated endonuclease Cas1 [Veillonella criceti]|uniref:CRISPR-associated endonuclease Cas1 n=1 Tax=Veillonella criceti TaxID=103891 RepID=A0A380NM65_9FIRM|nr:CRISPR-associated endonuclease Cas1 [Veillonella criceti]SUP43054.1 CRISPR-associated endonuclease Cas1 [Veillonella criceti]